MAYTNTWAEDIPAGTEQAKTIDNHIRQARLDVGERLASVFEDLDADPMVLKSSAFPAGGAAGKLNIFGSAFRGHEDHREEPRLNYTQMYVEGSWHTASIP